MMKRILSFLMAFCMVLTMLPAVYAETDPDAIAGTLPLDLPDQVNPLFADTEFDTELTVPENDGASPLAQPEYLLADDAAAQMREYMKNRVTSFTIYLKIPELTTDINKIQPVIMGLYDNALIHTGDPKEGDCLRWQYVRWNMGQPSYTGDFTGLKISIPYTVEYFTTAEQEAEVDQAVAELLEELDLYDACDYEKVLGIYSYIVENVDYDYNGLNSYTNSLANSVYAALINKSAICRGYSLLFYRLALELGVDAHMVVGDSNGDGSTDHAWNLVQVNGQYYLVDTTLDSEMGTRSWLLKGSENLTRHTPDYTYMEAGFAEAYPMAEHDFAHSVTDVVTDPTCTEKGYTTRTCSCGKTSIVNETEALGHAWDNGVVTKAPTAQEEGICTYTCTVCGETREETIPVSEHTHQYESVVTLPTCTEDGFTTYTCDCGDSYVADPVPMTGHDWLDSVVDPTCTEEGYTLHVCTVCGDFYADAPTDATGHSYEDGICRDCGEADPDYREEDPIRITAQPEDYIGLVGDMANFSVEAEGEDLRYQWYFFDKEASDWKKAGNGTSDVLSVEFRAYRNGQRYRCEITDVHGNTVVSDAVALIAREIDPVILSQSGDYAGSVNDEPAFTVEAEGNGLTYQWYYSDNGGASWNISGSPGFSTNTLKPILRAYRDGYQYYCRITDVFGNELRSEPVRMAVKSSAVKITQQPGDVTMAVLNQLYTFHVVAEGDNLTYRWEVSTNGGESWDLSWNQGYDTATLNVRMNANRDGNLYRCVVTSGLKTNAVSEPALLNLQDPSAEITGQPSNVAAVAGETVTFHVVASGNDLTYLWYRSDDKGATWTQTWLTGYNTDTLSFAANANRAAIYKCKITDGSGNSVWSDNAKLQILSSKLTILTQPVSVVCANGETAAFTVEAQGDGLKYQWYASEDGGESWIMTYLGGYNTNQLSFQVTEARAARMYKCVITDAAGNTVETYAVSVTVKANES